MESRKVIYIVISVILLLIMASTITILILRNYYSNMDRIISINYAYDNSTPEKAIGCANYTFVAKINSVVKTKYEDGTLLYKGNPTTIYNVTVIENIKGELVTTKDVEVEVFGVTVEKDRTYTIVQGGIEKLNIGSYYILLPYVGVEKGALGLIDSKDAVRLGDLEDEGTKNMISKYKKAYINQIVPESKTDNLKSMYDTEYNK